VPRGRRPGASATREALLEAARRRFAEVGFEGASIRAIAADAGVDPSLAIHFFGSKEELFRESVAWPFEPADLVRELEAGEGGMGERLARAFLGLWEDPRTRRSLLALLRSATTHEASARLLRQFLQGLLLRRLADALEGPQAELRIELAVSHLLGVAVFRHVLGVEPLASAGLEELAARLGPALDRHLADVEM